MSQAVLQIVESYPVVQSARGKGVAQTVRTDLTVNTGFAGQPLNRAECL